MSELQKLYYGIQSGHYTLEGVDLGKMSEEIVKAEHKAYQYDLTKELIQRHYLYDPQHNLLSNMEHIVAMMDHEDYRARRAIKKWLDEANSSDLEEFKQDVCNRLRGKEVEAQVALYFIQERDYIHFCTDSDYEARQFLTMILSQEDEIGNFFSDSKGLVVEISRVYYPESDVEDKKSAYKYERKRLLRWIKETGVDKRFEVG